MRAYNVGSDREVTVLELANEVVRKINRSASVAIRGEDTLMNVTRYLPSVDRLTSELNVKQTVFLDQALVRTYNWLGQATS